MKENTVQTYLDGVVVRMHNKRITVKDYVNDEKGGALIEITVARKELPTEDKPLTRVKITKGKVSTTALRISKEAMEGLYIALGYYLSNQDTTTLNEYNEYIKNK